MSHFIRQLRRLVQFRKLSKLLGFRGPSPMHDEWDLIPFDFAINDYLYSAKEPFPEQSEEEPLQTYYLIKLKSDQSESEEDV